MARSESVKQILVNDSAKDLEAKYYTIDSDNNANIKDKFQNIDNRLDAIVEAGTVGTATKGIYLNDGVPTAMTYELNKTVPSDAVFTDTKNTTGTTNLTATKLYLTGAQTQAANPQTYSNANCYIGSDGYLYSGGYKVITTNDAYNGEVE